MTLNRARSPRDPAGIYYSGVGCVDTPAGSRRFTAGPEYHLREIHMKIGAARKIDEYVPTITPMFIANAKFRTKPVPKMFMISVVANTVDDVKIVRTSISLIEMSMIRSIFLSLSFAWFSRIRPNTITVSFVE